MLVLSRKKSQKVLIGGGITITIVEIRGDKVRLGIDAPRETPVNRSEVVDRQALGVTPTSATATENPS